MAFKAGDRVRCVRAGVTRLKLGDEYIVERNQQPGDGGIIYLKGLGSWFANRFVLADEKEEEKPKAKKRLPVKDWKRGDKVYVKCLDGYSNRIPMEKFVGTVLEVVEVEETAWPDPFVRTSARSDEGYNFGWLASSLIHESEGLDEKALKKALQQQKKKVVKVKVDPPLRSTIQKGVVAGKGRGSMCVFGVRHEDGKNDIKWEGPCHYDLKRTNIDNYTPIVELVYNFYHDLRSQGRLEKGNGRQEHLNYADYILKESPWAECFRTKRATVGERYGIEMDVSKSANRIAAACIALREAREYKDVVFTFNYFKSKGYSGHVAYMLSRAFSLQGEVIKPNGFSNAHGVLDDSCDFKQLVEFFANGYNPEKENGGPYSTDRHYTLITKSIANIGGIGKSFAKVRQEHVRTVVQGEGWKETRVVNEESLLAFATFIEQQIKDAKK